MTTVRVNSVRAHRWAVVAVLSDPHLWLEELDDPRAMAWVTEQSEATLARLSGPRLETLREEALEIFDADTRIPGVNRRGGYLYNFWQDAAHPRGIWRRTTLEQYRTDTPNWDVLIDVDALAAAEGENWVFAGAAINGPNFRRTLVGLSRGGGDANVIREFDLDTKQFITDGFHLPEGKHEIEFDDDDTLLVGTDFGPGSLTESGYPRIIKRWRRGTPLEEAETVYEVARTAVRAGVSCEDKPGFKRTFFYRWTDFYNRETYQLRDGLLVRIDIPTDASMAVHREWAMLIPTSDWHRGDITYAAGSALITTYESLAAGEPEFHVLFEPGGRDIFAAAVLTGHQILSVKLRDVATVVETITPGTWDVQPLAGVPDNTNTGLAGLDDYGDEIFLYSSGFLAPGRLLHGPSAGPVTEIKSEPAFFDAEELLVTQRFTDSADGTRIPYFLISHRDCDQPRPTLLSGYGAFRMAQVPGYVGVLGRLWLARGGCYAVANIRGGGEYGIPWHEQVLRANRHKVAEDFAAVATDLVSTGVTTASQLGAMGGSAGGLLIGVMLTKYPELFGALVCDNPLLDMRRYHQLLAGPSWMAEFGNPDDPVDWEFIKDYSPYHNISAGRDYPPILIATTTSDDRVHPGHARKMAAALHEAGHRVDFYEGTQGGHGGATTNAEAAFNRALRYEFFLQHLT